MRVEQGHKASAQVADVERELEPGPKAEVPSRPHGINSVIARLRRNHKHQVIRTVEDVSTAFQEIRRDLDVWAGYRREHERNRQASRHKDALLTDREDRESEEVAAIAKKRAQLLGNIPSGDPYWKFDGPSHNVISVQAKEHWGSGNKRYDEYRNEQASVLEEKRMIDGVIEKNAAAKKTIDNKTLAKKQYDQNLVKKMEIQNAEDKAWERRREYAKAP